MRNLGLWGGLLLVVIILVVGVFVFRSPQDTATPISTTSIEEEAGPAQLENEVPLISPGATPSPSPSTPTTSAVPVLITEDQVVAIEDTGFTPATLTVATNTTVIFTNNGQGSHWPASDPHPSHNNLPGFDAKRGLATGESYSFTFTQPGTWGYHDHLNTRLRGSIIVQ